MKKINTIVLLFLLLQLSSCSAIAGIFKAGFWTAIVLVIALGVVVGIVASKRKRK